MFVSLEKEERRVEGRGRESGEGEEREVKNCFSFPSFRCFKKLREKEINIFSLCLNVLKENSA